MPVQASGLAEMYVPAALPPDNAVLLKFSKPLVAEATGAVQRERASTGAAVPTHMLR